MSVGVPEARRFLSRGGVELPSAALRLSKKHCRWIRYTSLHPLVNSVKNIPVILFLSLVTLPATAQDKTIALQSEINHLMANQSGSVVVLGVSSGKILAQWHLNIAAQRLERPGSTVKPFVLMELLAKRKINPEQHLMCRRPLYVQHVSCVPYRRQRIP